MLNTIVPMALKKRHNQITKEGYEKLLNELKDLKERQMPETLERLSEAKALWDLSENFEYKSALEDRDLINSKVAELEDLLADAVIITEDANKKKTGVVDYGSKVELELEDGKKYNVTIVWAWEVSIDGWELRVSLDSPIGSAIKWKKKWATVSMRIGNDRQDVKILSVA